VALDFEAKDAAFVRDFKARLVAERFSLRLPEKFVSDGDGLPL
jgi:hypothetical protein